MTFFGTDSLKGGSEIYVNDEHGNVVESLPGFTFGPSSGIQVVAKTRTGWVDGPNADQLQSFTYWRQYENDWSSPAPGPLAKPVLRAALTRTVPPTAALLGNENPLMDSSSVPSS